MATRRQAQRRSLLQFLALVIAIVIIVVAVVLFQSWLNNRPGPLPQEVAISASAHPADSAPAPGTTGAADNARQSLDVFPYFACELGHECDEGEIPNLRIAPDEVLYLELPEAIYNHDWQVLFIYDDPAANDQILHGGFDATSVTVPGSVDPIAASSSGANGQRPRLMLVEVSAVMVGQDAAGEETPLATVWSLTTMSPEERAAAEEKS